MERISAVIKGVAELLLFVKKSHELRENWWKKDRPADMEL